MTINVFKLPPFLKSVSRNKTWRYVIFPHVTIPNVTIPRVVKIPNINRNPAIPTKLRGGKARLGEGERE